MQNRSCSCLPTKSWRCSTRWVCACRGRGLLLQKVYKPRRRYAASIWPLSTVPRSLHSTSQHISGSVIHISLQNTNVTHLKAGACMSSR